MKTTAFLFAITSAFCGLNAGATTITLEPVEDNTLYSENFAQLSNGQGAFLFAGRNMQDSLRRALLGFDLSAIPAGSTITSVALMLSMNLTNSGASNFSLHRVLVNWGEGASNAGTPGGSGASAAPGDATWTHAIFPGTLWSTEGGDFVPAASATTNVNAVGSYQWTSPQMTADVQNWLNAPATNFGWLLKDTEAAVSAKRFISSEGSAASRPKLVISYDVAPADSEPDGLPDIWENFWFENLTSANETSDFDGDGSPDVSEYIAGSSPKDPRENFRASISRNGAQLHATVTERPATGTGYAGLTRRYAWFSAIPAQLLQWQPAAGVSASVGGEFTLDAPLIPEAGLFLRCDVRLEPTAPAPPPVISP